MDSHDSDSTGDLPDGWYYAAKLFASVFLVSVVFLFGGDLWDLAQEPLIMYDKVAIPGAPEEESSWPLALVISLGALVTSGLGTVSAVILGWRNERRQATEFKLRIEALEFQLAEARRNQPPPSDAA